MEEKARGGGQCLRETTTSSQNPPWAGSGFCLHPQVPVSEGDRDSSVGVGPEVSETEGNRRFAAVYLTNMTKYSISYLSNYPVKIIMTQGNAKTVFGRQESARNSCGWPLGCR